MKAITYKPQLLSLVGWTLVSLSQHVGCFQVASWSKSHQAQIAPIPPISAEQRVDLPLWQSRRVLKSNSVTDHQYRLLVVKLTAKNDDADGDDNDGWDTGSNMVPNSAQVQANAETRYTNSAEPPYSLQQPTNIQQQRNDLDRKDFFIPIFTLVAIGGLLGAYGYEMLRLYLRGELYLPFLH